MRNVIKKNKYLYSLLVNIKRKIWVPVKQGKVSFYIKYCITTKTNETNKLKTYGLTDVKPFAYADWRNGKGRDHAFRRYYIATYNGKKVFIKIGIGDVTVANEYQIMKGLENAKVSFVAPMLCGDGRFDINTTMLAVEFIPNLTRFAIPVCYNDFKKMCEQFYTILAELNKRAIVHADIHAGNLMLQDEKIYLLDFGISKVKGIENGIDYRFRPGTFYRTTNNKRRYDDAYSFIQLLEKIGIKEEWKNSDSYKRITELIDNNCFDVIVK